MFITKRGAIFPDNTKFLARLILGDEKVSNVEDDGPEPTSKQIGFRMDRDLYDKIEGYKKRAKVSRTSIMETLLWSGIQVLEEEITLRGQLSLPVETVKKKAVKK